MRFVGDGVAEIKRMWTDPSVRGGGVAKALLAPLQAKALAAGVRRLRLETNAALA